MEKEETAGFCHFAEVRLSIKKTMPTFVFDSNTKNNVENQQK